MIKGLLVPENSYDADPTSFQTAQPMTFATRAEFDAFVAANFSDPAVFHRLEEKVCGFDQYVQEYDPMHYNDTATALFHDHGVSRFPGDDTGGILGHVLFFRTDQ